MEVSGRRQDDQSHAKDGEVFCQPCSSDGDWLVAKGYCTNCNEFFCAACLKFHRKQSATRNHVILEGKVMPKSPAPVADVEYCSDLCAKHNNEIVKFYCISHDTVGCGDCMVLEHKVCKVERIQDISNTYFNSPEHRELVGKVRQFLENIEDIKTCIQTAEQDISTTYTQAVADIKTFRKEVNDYLNIVEAEILAELNKRNEEDRKTVSGLEENRQYLQNEIRELEEKLKMQSNKANELFVASKKMKGRIASFDITIKQMVKKADIQQYRFERSPGLNLSVCSKLPFGKLTRINTHSRKKIEDMKPRFDSEINIKGPRDKYDCFIIASELISPSRIVLADYQNNCVKLVDIDQGELLGRYELCGKPEDIALVNENLVAVTLPNTQKIQMLYFTKMGMFKESHDIKVNGKGRKIACQNDTLIVAYSVSVEIMDNNGKVVKRITYSDFSWIVNLAFAHNSKTFYVTNSVSNDKPTAVYKFDFCGNVLAIFKDTTLLDVRGLTLTPDDTVLVCNWADDGSIYVLSSECKKIKEILQHNEHVKWSYCVSFCEQTNKLFLCNYSGFLQPEQTNVVKQFQMM
ncbi:uncharacterized protein LOC123548384 [Mercenaria mercenaria]|uniref:uncharacterized protein LOC123548384 n=1 Tax=Mercenaria mercenaria TaxID=6596 RepID=UPI001E1E2263|nr:uncharacterized protein LOC123548384 [Mercenaria mercenaria]XP_045191526.1 uncharacterized protein LOC123548384 [Mercenaria mercenaria]